MDIRPEFKSRIDKIRHKANPLHIYCRLVDYGFNEDVCYYACSKYDKFFQKINKYIFRKLENYK